MSRALYCDRCATSEQGAIALLTVLILMAGSLAIVTGLSLRGIGNLQAVDTHRRGEETFPGTEGCVAEALRRLRDNAGYAGGTLSVGTTTCTVTVTDDGGGQRTIRSAATLGTTTRHIRAVAQVGTVVLSGRTVGTLTLTSWEETLQ